MSQSVRSRHVARAAAMAASLSRRSQLTTRPWAAGGQTPLLVYPRRRRQCFATVPVTAPAREADLCLNGGEGAEAARLLRDDAARLRDLRAAWQALAPEFGKSSSEVLQLTERFAAVRESLRACPFGDPAESTTPPRHECGDPVVAAHGEATRALIELELARAEWDLRARSGRQEMSLLVDVAVLRLRLFDLAGAHEALCSAESLGSNGASDPRWQMLARYCALLRGPRQQDFLAAADGLQPGTRAEQLLRKARDTLLKAGYTSANVLRATKASSMSELIFVDTRADNLERGLLESSEEANPMMPETDERFRASGAQVDLIRVFLLHRVLPLTRLCQLLGDEVVSLLLGLRVLQALEGSACNLVPPERAIAEVESNDLGCGGLLVASNVAVWPVEEDLLICTDFEQTYSEVGLEPVMYISEDSWALACAAPRRQAARVLDLCCGSGIQGIVALRCYAERACFVDLNPRALRFTRLNLALNGLAGQSDGVFHGSLYEALPAGSERFDVILANPPFVPNPSGIASGAGALFGDGGDTGERVLAEIIRGAPRFLEPGGRLCTVSMAPNVDDLPSRLRDWWLSADDQAQTSSSPQLGLEGLIFRGPPTTAERYQPTSTPAETARYQAAMRKLGIATLSEVVLILTTTSSSSEKSSSAIRAELAGDARQDLWSDHEFLRLVVQCAGGQGDADDLNVAVADVAHSAPPASEAQALLGSRDGCLPGFQAGFFPARCVDATPEWAAVAKRLALLAAQRRRL